MDNQEDKMTFVLLRRMVFTLAKEDSITVPEGKISILPASKLFLTV